MTTAETLRFETCESDPDYHLKMRAADELDERMAIEHQRDSYGRWIAELETKVAELENAIRSTCQWLEQTHIAMGDEGAVMERDQLVAAIKGEKV